MEESILRQAQLRMLDILKEVDKICRENNIQYWISDGTMLGAVRHKGFIPWDDDIDICMLPEDYEKFLKVAISNLDQTKYFLAIKTTDKKVIVNYAKVRDRKSTILEKEDEEEKYHQGIFIDVFPMNYLKEKNYYFNKKLYNSLLKIKDFVPERGTNRKIKKLCKILGVSKISEIVFNSLFVSKHKQNLIGYKYHFTNISNLNWIFPLKEIEFERHKFYCPKNSDAYLTALYGDYMQLPPENERVWHSKEIRLNEKCFFERELERTGRKLYEK